MREALFVAELSKKGDPSQPFRNTGRSTIDQLAGQTALVCGASKGIGRAVAEELANNGARVVLLARDAAGLEKSVKGLKNSSRHFTIVQDLNDSNGLRQSIKALL